LGIGNSGNDENHGVDRDRDRDRDCGDENNNNDDGNNTGEDDNDDDDAPTYNMVTGKYEQKHHKVGPLNLSALPGQGKLTNFESAAADFMKNRSYKGLDPQIGKTEVK